MDQHRQPAALAKKETSTAETCGPLSSSEKLFDYKISDRRTPSSVSGSSKKTGKKGADAFLAKPVIRMPTRSRRSTAGDFHQHELRLEALPPLPEKSHSSAEDSSAPVPVPAVNREILFSRFLCGIIDIALPVLTGMVFTLLAAWILELDILYAASLEWAAVFSLSLFLFNSVFFLLTSGQTPGMYLTELRLVNEGNKSAPGAGAIIARVVFFVPLALTGIGLIWCVLDPLCRGLHDLLSNTHVEPVS